MLRIRRPNKGGWRTVSAWTPHKDNRGVNGVHEYKSHTSEENLTRRVTDTSLFPCGNMMVLAQSRHEQLGDIVHLTLIYIIRYYDTLLYKARYFHIEMRHG